MLSENALKRTCKPVVLRRARRIAESDGSINRRKCRFDEGETVLRARVDSHASWEEAHRTMVVLDETTDAITYFECDCHSARVADTPCDHVIAVIMDYNSRPEAYEGYAEKGRLRTSRNVLRLMEQLTALPPIAPATSPTEIEQGTVRLEATLAYEVGFDVRFRIIGSKGSYALKSIREFVERVEDKEFAEYGKRLAFEHTVRSFAPQAQHVVRFLTRAVQNRRAYAKERVTGRYATGAADLLPTRELHLSAPELWDLLELYQDTGLLFEDRSLLSVGSDAPHMVRIVEGDPQIQICIEPLPDNEGFELLRTNETRVVAVGSGALAWDKATLYRCTRHISRNVELLSTMLSHPEESLVVSNADAPAFCASVLQQLESCAQVEVPARLHELRPQPCKLEFYLDYNAMQALVTCDARATYGDVSLPLIGVKKGASPHEPADVVRDVQTEAHGREVLHRYFVVRDGVVFSKAQGEDLGALVYEGVAALQEIGTVFAFPAFKSLRSKAQPHVRVGLSVRSKLLELDLKLEGLPQDELVGLLESYGDRRTYHQLKDGSIVRVADVSLAEASRVASELGLSAKQMGSTVAVPAYRAMLLDGLVDDDGKDDAFVAYVNRIRTHDMGSFKVPPHLLDVLRPYQTEGFRWLCGLGQMGLGGILADEMGLGKSVQLISFLSANARELRNAGPALIVCPSSLVYNWKAEFAKFAPKLKVSVVAGTPAERQELRDESKAEVFITSYDLLRRDVDDYENRRLWCVALDEAQYIKNPSTQAAQAVKRLDANNHVALTGTPVENRLSELWSIFDFLMPGLLGSYGRFRERFERPIVEDEDPQVAERLREALRPFILRRLKRDVAADLPDKIEQVVRTHMADEQKRLYQAQVQEVRNRVSELEDSPGQGKFQILALLTRLRQICCDPQLLYQNYDAGSCKTDAVVTLVERVADAGEKMLLFSQFTSYLDVLASELRRRGIAHYTIIGETPSAQRVELVNRFNADATPVFLISLKAGGTGLNLTSATVVVHADPWWNAAAQNQATDRAHRIGQTREVTVYKVIVGNTIEERIMELQRTKAELADAVVQGDVSSMSLSSLTKEDLEDLLG